MKFKKWHIISVVIILGLSGSLAYEMTQPDELDLRIKERKEKEAAEAVKTVKKTSFTNEVNINNAVKEQTVLPPRVLNAPVYDRLLMAARIENEAINQQAANHFVTLTTNRRNARLAAEIARYQAETKSYEADFQESVARIKSSKEGKFLIDSADVAQNRTNIAIEALAEGTESKPKDNSISLRTFDEKSNEMMIKVGERWFTSVKTGQTIDGYLVGIVDSALKCVPLTKNEKVQVICLN